MGCGGIDIDDVPGKLCRQFGRPFAVLFEDIHGRARQTFDFSKRDAAVNGYNFLTAPVPISTSSPK